MVELELKAYSPQNVRIIRSKSRSKEFQARPYCFVDFSTVEHAKIVYQTIRANEKRGIFLEIDGARCYVEYAESPSKPRTQKKHFDPYGDYDEQVYNLPSGMSAYGESAQSANFRMDWICLQTNCQAQNFARRQSCFRCGTARSADCLLLDPTPTLSSSTGTGVIAPETSASIGATAPTLAGSMSMLSDLSPPSDTLILRNLAPSSAETSVQQALRIFSPSIHDVRLIRNKDHSSRGFCFVEFVTVESASVALSLCLKEGLIVDGQQVSVAFASGQSHAQNAKGRSQSTGSGLESSSQWSHSQGGTRKQGSKDDYDDYDTSFDEPGFNNTKLEAQKAKMEEAQAISLAEAAAVLKKKKSPFPPTFEEAGAAYVFDAASGYFYEASSGWYYEPKTKLYYGVPELGGTEQKWHVHRPGQDPPFEVYDPLVGQQKQAEELSSQPAQAELTTTIDQPAADLPSTQQEAPEPAQQAPLSTPAVSAWATPSALPIPVSENLEQPPPKKKKKVDLATWEAKKKKQEEAMKAPVITLKMTHKIKPLTPEPAPVVVTPSAELTSGAPTATTEKISEENPPANVGEDKKPAPKKISTACLLCKRGFATVDQLKKHEEKSALHKENLAKALLEGTPIPKSVLMQEQEQLHLQRKEERDQHRKAEKEIAAAPVSKQDAEKEENMDNSSFMIADAPAPTFSIMSNPNEQGESLSASHTVDEILAMDVAPTYKDRATLRREISKPISTPIQQTPLQPQYDFEIPPPTPEEAALYLDSRTDFRASTSMPIHHQQSNVGAEMLQKMGWRDGQGLGRDGSGMVTPVQADNSFEGNKYGIGTQKPISNAPTVNPDESYKDTIHRVSQARFENADQNLSWTKRTW